MKYSVFILRRAQKELGGLSLEVYPRVLDAIRNLAHDPRPPGVRKLIGREGWHSASHWRSSRRVRLNGPAPGWSRNRTGHERSIPVLRWDQGTRSL